MSASEVTARLDELRAEIGRLTLAVGFLGQALYQLNGHRTPLELRGAIGAWEEHAAETALPLRPNERRYSGPVTNASMDAEVARHAC